MHLHVLALIGLMGVCEDVVHIARVHVWLNRRKKFVVSVEER